MEGTSVTSTEYINRNMDVTDDHFALDKWKVKNNRPVNPPNAVKQRFGEFGCQEAGFDPNLQGRDRIPLSLSRNGVIIALGRIGENPCRKGTKRETPRGG